MNIRTDNLNIRSKLTQCYINNIHDYGKSHTQLKAFTIHGGFQIEYDNIF